MSVVKFTPDEMRAFKVAYVQAHGYQVNLIEKVITLDLNFRTGRLLQGDGVFTLRIGDDLWDKPIQDIIRGIVGEFSWRIEQAADSALQKRSMEITRLGDLKKHYTRNVPDLGFPAVPSP